MRNCYNSNSDKPLLPIGRYLSLKIINISKKKQKQAIEQYLVFNGIVISF